MRASDNRYERDIRKHTLARRMLTLGARTSTIIQWTGLSRYRVQALARRYEHREYGDPRRRGISPYTVSYFGQTPSLELESLVLAFIVLEMHVIPPELIPDARASLPELGRGERLLDAFDWYRRLVPMSQISLERAVLLVLEFAEGQTLSLARCSTCPNVMLVDQDGTIHARCPACRTGHRNSPGTGQDASTSSD